MVIIKRYPNRKLYNTAAKQYITLDGIADLIRDGQEIQVIDHAGGEDLTALTLTQIILEQEKKQGGMMTNTFLTGLIRSGGDRLSAFQRNLPSPLNFWKQIDEEIKKRVQGLVQQGELSREEAASLIDKLAKQGLHYIKDSRAVTEDRVESYLREQHVPTNEDIQRLTAQLEDLALRIDQMMTGEADALDDNHAA